MYSTQAQMTLTQDGTLVPKIEALQLKVNNLQESLAYEKGMESHGVTATTRLQRAGAHAQGLVGLGEIARVRREIAGEEVAKTKRDLMETNSKINRLGLMSDAEYKTYLLAERGMSRTMVDQSTTKQRDESR